MPPFKCPLKYFDLPLHSTLVAEVDGCVAAGEHAVPAVDPLAALHVQAGGPDHLQEHPHDAEAQGNINIAACVLLILQQDFRV